MNKNNERSATTMMGNGGAIGSSDAPASNFQGALTSENCVTYRMRTECASDADLARCVLGRWVLGWNQQYACVDGAGVVGFPDVDVELKVQASAPSAECLRWLLSKVATLHVAAESLDHAHAYTSQRINYSLVEAGRPDDSVIAEAMEAVKRYRHPIRQQSSSIGRLIETLRIEMSAVPEQGYGPRSTAQTMRLKH
jgi:hypothetical protein